MQQILFMKFTISSDCKVRENGKGYLHVCCQKLKPIIIENWYFEVHFTMAKYIIIATSVNLIWRMKYYKELIQTNV